MRRPFSRKSLISAGVSPAQIRWKLKTGHWQKLGVGVYLEGSAPPTPLERALAVVAVTNGVASYSLAGVLLNFDGVRLQPPFVTLPLGLRKMRPGTRFRSLAPESIIEVDSVRCTNGHKTLIDLASVQDDIRWEQALEYALRKRMTSIPAIEAELPLLGATKTPGTTRIRRALALRPEGAPPTESLLETLMVQLIRAEPRLPEPTRQVVVLDKYGDFVARVDLAWPEFGIFTELDGQHHKDQPVYDSRRETAVVAATGWRPARFSWTEVTRIPDLTARRLVDIFDACS